MLTLAIITISIIVNVLPAFLVIFSNPKSATHRYFFILTFAFVSFGLVNYVSLHAVFLKQIIWIRFDLFVAVYLFLFLYLTFLAFPNKRAPHLSRFDKCLIVFSVLVSCLTLSPWVFSRLEITSSGVQPVAAAGILLFIIQQLTMLLLTMRLCLRKFQKSRGIERRQLRAVISGTTFAVMTIIVFNLIAVQGFHNDAFVPYSSLGVVAFTFSFLFALVRYRFLNFRVLVARSLAYILLLSSMVGVYALLVFILTDKLFSSNGSVVFRQSVPILVAILLALTAPVLKKFFDKLTNRIFYQDAYDPQAFLDQLNRVLVGNIELDILLRHTARVIEENLKSSFCVVTVQATAMMPGRVIGSDKPLIDLIDGQFIHNQLQQINQSILLADDLDQRYAPLKKVLENHNVALMVRLASGYGTQHSQTVAYLLLGIKKSGNIYNKQDLRIVKIIGDELAIAIQNALRFEEIQQFNITLQGRISGATAKLKRTNAKLMALDEAKDDFISMASHQLRTPLTSIKGYTSMVLEGDAGEISATQKKLLTQSYLSAQRMVYMIADLLNVSRLRTGKFIIETTPLNLADVIEQELEQLKETASARSLQLIYKKPQDFPLLMLDETKIRQVIMNFVDNAIYYTPAGGHISVELQATPTVVELRVVDDGIGVPKSEQPHLFTKFYRAANARKARPDGTGLGIFMAKKVIIAQGGALIFDSHEGAGSTFGFVFSRAQHGVPASQPSRSS